MDLHKYLHWKCFLCTCIVNNIYIRSLHINTFIIKQKKLFNLIYEINRFVIMVIGYYYIL
jgi:hypothetical protein